MAKTNNKQARALDLKRTKQALELLKADTRATAMFLLSVKAGLRSKEIAMLTWDRLDFERSELLLTATKGDRHRTVPMAADLKAALGAYRAERGEKATGYVFRNQQSRPGEPLSPNAVAVWFKDLYCRRLGWQGYSSHSGRRSAITGWARKVSEAGGSLRDVQALAGHADLSTTSRYIETSPDAQKKLVDLI